MVDPTSIVGVLGVCVQLAKEIIRYSTSFKHAPEHATNLVAEVAAVDHVLSTLHTHLEKENVKGRSTFARTSVLYFAVNGCQKRLKDIHDTIQSLVSRNKYRKFWGRLTWPFEKSETMDAMFALHRFVQIFHFSLSLDGL